MHAGSVGQDRGHVNLDPAASMRYTARMAIDDTIIDTPDGPMTWAQWKKKNPVQLPSRRTKGKKLPNKVKLRTDE